MDFYRNIPKFVVCITNLAMRQSGNPYSCRLTGQLYLRRSTGGSNGDTRKTKL